MKLTLYNMKTTYTFTPEQVQSLQTAKYNLENRTPEAEKVAHYVKEAIFQALLEQVELIEQDDCFFLTPNS